MRPQLAALVSALRSSNSSHREERSKSPDWDLLTRAFPVWVVSAQELSRVVPLQQDLFDLVILDDANQCSLPLALPALQRAPRAVVVGDPGQLRHLSSLSRERQRHLALKHGVENVTLDLDYRERSLLDYALNAAAGSQSIVVLDDHFRSHPALFDFINQRFYGGRVKVLTHHKENPGQPPVELAECPVQVVADVNMGEVDAVARRLKAFIEESRELPDNDCPTIGVMAFFPATALRLKHELLKQFEPHILRRHDFRVGTPLAFQGDERDIMLIATSVYPGRADAAWSHINRPDLFNLAVTRARHRQIMFIPKGALGSVAPSLLADYLVHVKQAQARSTVPKDLPPDSMRSELISTLESWGARCRTDYPFAGQTLDMVALYGDHVLAIDTVGTLSAVGTAWDWERYRLLERAGLSVFPISYLDWEERRHQVLEELRKAFGGAEMGLELQGIQHFRALRWRLEELREPEPLGLLDALERAYRQSVRWLQLRFQPTELTYDRYHQSIEGLQQAAFTELDGATRLLEGLRDLTPEAGLQVRRDVQARLEECGRANAALNALAERLALLRTSDSGLQGATAEVNRLAERVSRYDASSKREAGD
jgi:hypothetical protein